MTSTQGRMIVAVILAGALTLAGCGGDDDAAPAAVSPATTALDDVATTDGVTTTAAVVTTSDATTAGDVSASTAPSADGWDPAVMERCGHIWKGITGIQWPESAAAIESWASHWQEHLDAAPAVEEGRFPVAAVGDVGGYDETTEAALDELADAAEAGAAEDVDGALLAAERADDLLVQSQAMLGVAGVRLRRPAGSHPLVPRSTSRCSAPGRWGPASTPSGSPSSSPNAVARVDPASGRVLATVDVGSTPVKLQPADGRMWVRTSDAYVAIDPATNTVTTTLAKADVGPEANRSWAVDGALWICDGSRLHRYDPIDASLVTTVDLGIDCGQVYATSDLAVAWTYNEDDGESGASAAAFIDPATNGVVAEVDLPVDVNVPVVADDTVFFPGYRQRRRRLRRPSVLDRDGAPPRRAARRKSGDDRRHVHLRPDGGEDAIAVIDAHPMRSSTRSSRLEINSLVATADGLWAVSNVFGYLQRFDLGT